ncbi:MAG: hypothetical protein ABJC98_15835 [Bacteroidota bacterium]
MHEISYQKVFITTSLLFILIVAFGHEYILMAYHFKVNKGDTLEIHLFVADGFNVQLERPVQHSIIKKFELLTLDNKVDLTKQPEGSLPVISRLVDFEGGGLVHMERDYARIALPTTKFFEYLKEDHLDGISTGVDKKKKEQRERYTRYIKALVQSGQRYNDTIIKPILASVLKSSFCKTPTSCTRVPTSRQKYYLKVNR